MDIAKFVGHSFWRYCVVGALGFVADWAVLQAMVQLTGADPVVGRVVSVVVALTTTWGLHRWFTFAVIGRPNFLEWTRYMLSNAVGALTNFSVYTGMILMWPGLGLTIPLIVSSIVALTVNYAGAAYFVFKHDRQR